MKFEGVLYFSVTTITLINGIQASSPIVDQFNVVVTASSGDAATLPTASQDGCWVVIINSSGNAIKAFPPVGGTIDGGAVDAAFNIANGQRAEFISYGALDWLSINTYTPA